MLGQILQEYYIMLQELHQQNLVDFLLLVEDTTLSISKTDAYFSITSARKAASALHSSSAGVEHPEEVGLFSVRWHLFNRRLHFLAAKL